MAWSTIPTFAGSDVLTSTNLNDYISQNFLAIKHVKARQTEELIKNGSATFADLVGLKFTVRSGETWHFFGAIYFNSDPTPDAKFTVLAPFGSTGRFGIFHNSVTSAAASATFGSAVTVDVAAQALETAILGGTVIAGGDGVVQVQAAQNTSAAFNTTFSDNGWLVAFRRAS